MSASWSEAAWREDPIRRMLPKVHSPGREVGLPPGRGAAPRSVGSPMDWHRQPRAQTSVLRMTHLHPRPAPPAASMMMGSVAAGSARPLRNVPDRVSHSMTRHCGRHPSASDSRGIAQNRRRRRVKPRDRALAWCQPPVRVPAPAIRRHCRARTGRAIPGLGLQATAAPHAVAGSSALSPPAPRFPTSGLPLGRQGPVRSAATGLEWGNRPRGV